MPHHGTIAHDGIDLAFVTTTTSTESDLFTHLNILHLVAPTEVGGLESVVRLLATGHTRMGHNVAVAAVLTPSVAARGRHTFLDALRADGVEALPIVVPGRAYLQERRVVRELCRRLRPDVVHTHGYRSDIVGASAARALGVPTVTTVHGFTGGDAKNHLYEWLQQSMFRRFDAVVAVSSGLGAQLRRRGVPETRLHVIPNAFDDHTPLLDRNAAREALGVPEGQFVVGWVGRVSREKGADVLVDALAAIDDDAIRVSIIGDGPDRMMLAQRAERLGVASRISWHGMIPDAGCLFPAFDVYALSSRTEGMPIVLFEAMAAGIPIVATRVGGVPDVVGPEEALLVPPNEPAAIAAALRETRANPGAAAGRARAARATLSRTYCLEPWLARYEALYDQVRSPIRGSAPRP